MGILAGSIRGQANVGAPTLTVWWAMSGVLMEDAAMHARRALEIESKGPLNSLHLDDRSWHRSLSISGVILAGSALEAYANEAFLSPQNRQEGKPFTASELADIYQRWSLPKSNGGFERLGVLEKFDKALSTASTVSASGLGGTTLREECAKALDLRNGLVHFKTRPFPSDPTILDPHNPLEAMVMNCAFAERPYYPKRDPEIAGSPDSPPFPAHCFSYACVKWAITSHLALADQFASKLGVAAISAPNARTLI
jgi:hypothetical protein